MIAKLFGRNLRLNRVFPANCLAVRKEMFIFAPINRKSVNSFHGNLHQQRKRSFPPGSQQRICGQVGADSRGEQYTVYREKVEAPVPDRDVAQMNVLSSPLHWQTNIHGFNRIFIFLSRKKSKSLAVWRIISTFAP